jgi:hypothetical protein
MFSLKSLLLTAFPLVEKGFLILGLLGPKLTASESSRVLHNKLREQ